MGAASLATGILATPMLARRDGAMTLSIWAAGLFVWFILGWRLSRVAEEAGAELTFKVVPWPLWVPIFIWALLAEAGLATETGAFGRHMGTWRVFDEDWTTFGLYALFVASVLNYNLLRITWLRAFAPPRR